MFPKTIMYDHRIMQQSLSRCLSGSKRAFSNGISWCWQERHLPRSVGDDLRQAQQTSHAIQFCPFYLLSPTKFSVSYTASSATRLFTRAPELSMDPKPVYSPAEELSFKSQRASLWAGLRSHKVSNCLVSYALGSKFF